MDVFSSIYILYKGGNRGLTPTLIFIKGFCNFCKKMHKPLGGKKKNGAEGTPKIFRARCARARLLVIYTYFLLIYYIYYNIRWGPMTFPGSRAKRAQRAKRALYYIYNIVTVLPRSASGPARSRIDWISRSRRALSVQSAQRAAVAEGLRRREAPAKTRAGEDQMRYSGTGNFFPVTPSS